MFANQGYDADVANAGITGQNSVGHILNFHNWFNYISNLNPKYIIAFVGINERGVGAERKKNIKIFERIPKRLVSMTNGKLFVNGSAGTVPFIISLKQLKEI